MYVCGLRVMWLSVRGRWEKMGKWKWNDADELVGGCMHWQMWTTKCLLRNRTSWFLELSERMKKNRRPFLQSRTRYSNAKYHFSISIMIRYMSLYGWWHKKGIEGREWKRKREERERLGGSGREGRSVFLPQPLLFSTTSLAMRKRLFCGNSFVLQEYVSAIPWYMSTYLSISSSYPFSRSAHIAHKPTSAFSRSISQTLTLTHTTYGRHKIFSLVSCYGAAVAVSFHCLRHTHTHTHAIWLGHHSRFIANKCGILLVAAIERVKHC